MSEYQTIWGQWERGLAAEHHASGRRPDTCMMGNMTYPAFCEACHLKHGLLVDKQVGEAMMHRGRFTYDNIVICISKSLETGMIFGHRRPEIV